MDQILKALLCLPLMLYYTLEAIVLWFVPWRLRYKNIKGETVLITGAACGLGRQLALKFSKEGCRVVLVDINQRGLEETRKIIRDKSEDVFLYRCDVSKREAVYEMAAKVRDEVGEVTILVNNAGVVTGKRFLECPDDKILKTFEVNALAHFWTCKAFLPDMIKNNHGHLVSIASLAGHAGGPRMSDYCSSKFAAVGFDESLRVELIADKVTGVKSTVVCPYHINTDLFNGFRTRIFGALSAEYVADEVISAVRVNKEVVFVPWFFCIFCILKWLLPFSAMKVLMDACGLLNCMDNFQGRKKIE